MPKESKFDAEKLRKMIVENKDANEICDTFGIKKTTLNAYLLKLMKMDKKYYEVPGMNARIFTPKVTKLGLKISLDKLKGYGFEEGDEITIQKHGDGSIIIKKK